MFEGFTDLVEVVTTIASMEAMLHGPDEVVHVQRHAELPEILLGAGESVGDGERNHLGGWGWQVNPSTQVVSFTATNTAAPATVIPKKATIASNLVFAKELESIV